MKTTKRVNTTFSAVEQQEIANLMESKGTSRKTAVRRMRANQKAAAALRQAAEKNTPDFKQAAANDIQAAVNESAAKMPKTDAGKARSAGIQDFILAGRPSKADFIAVYGPTGPKLTWVARAALGVDAAHFQRALKAGKCVAPVAK